MNLKTLYAAVLAMLTISPSSHAQKTFNEVSYTPGKTTFRLNAPTEVDAVTSASPQQASTPSPRVTLRLYEQGQGGKALKSIKMEKAGKNQWQVVVKGNLQGRFYTFDTGHGETPGVFAKAVGVNGHRGAIIDESTTQPEGWAEDKPAGPALRPTDYIIYELHHRDFSIDASSGLRYKGKFLALTEPKAIAYLKELGVNAVHLLPSFDYASVDETQPQKPQYNWGYDPLNYNVPEGSYATDATQPAVRIREFKQMVQALHRAGIRVILDVVYNHTFDLAGSNFERTFPGVYYRYNADGSPSNGTGCGNETASEKPLMREFMKESMRYWADEYHIDGFRVDLMGVHDITTMNLIAQDLRKSHPDILIYGEGWSAGPCAYPLEKLAVKAHIQQMPGIAAFSDEMRDALRGPFSDDTKGGFLAGVANTEESLKFGIVGGVSHPDVDLQKVNYAKTVWANEPGQFIAYVSCHDDMCLVDRLKASIPGISEDELIRLDLLAQTAIFTSQGVPFMLSGEEMLRNKKGVHNSYNAPDSINHLDWNNLKRYPQVFEYYKGLIALRKQYPIFRLGSAEAIRRQLHFLPSQQGLVAWQLTDEKNQLRLFVALNANKEARQIPLPAGEYHILARDGHIDTTAKATLTIGEKGTDVAPQSALIVVQSTTPTR